MSKHEQQPATEPGPEAPEPGPDADRAPGEAGPGVDQTPTEAASGGAPSEESGAPGQAAEEPGAPGPARSEESDASGQARSEESVVAAKIAELEELAAERTHDLQRLQAEYANYKKRVDRDRSLARQGGIEAVVLDLLPVLDSIEAAREHDELTGGFKLVADELERLAGKYGLTVYGEVGEEFDPNVHDALLHVPMEGVEVTTVSAIMQKGVRLNEKVLRPARVGVAEPE